MRTKGCTAKQAEPKSTQPAQQMETVTITKGPGKLLPWGEHHNLLLLTPTVISGLIVPKWVPEALAPGYLGIKKNAFDQSREAAHPFLEDVRQYVESRIETVISDREKEDKEPKEIRVEDEVRLGPSEALEEEDWDWEAMWVGDSLDVIEVSEDDFN